MGQHYLDPVQYILAKDTESPVEIETDAPVQYLDAVGTWHRIRMKYADGCEIILDGENKQTDSDFFSGPKGKLSKSMKSDIPNLDQKLAQLSDPEPPLADFIQAVKTRKKFALNEINGHRSCTLINISSRSLCKPGACSTSIPKNNGSSPTRKRTATSVSQRVLRGRSEVLSPSPLPRRPRLVVSRRSGNFRRLEACRCKKQRFVRIAVT
ncbi:MAG: hypothetical protein EXS30_11640 [Pedosphaera sp.]|nr:hypothetical protein [Pedosphaera sp.]